MYNEFMAWLWNHTYITLSIMLPEGEWRDDVLEDVARRSHQYW